MINIAFLGFFVKRGYLGYNFGIKSPRIAPVCARVIYLILKNA